MKQNVSKVAGACFYHLKRLRQIGRHINNELMAQPNSAFETSRLDICTSVHSRVSACLHHCTSTLCPERCCWTRLTSALVAAYHDAHLKTKWDDFCKIYSEVRECLCHSRDDYVVALVVLACHFTQHYFMCVCLVVGWVLHNHWSSYVECVVSAKGISIAALLSSSRCIVKYFIIRNLFRSNKWWWRWWWWWWYTDDLETWYSPSKLFYTENQQLVQYNINWCPDIIFDMLSSRFDRIAATKSHQITVLRVIR